MGKVWNVIYKIFLSSLGFSLLMNSGCSPTPTDFICKVVKGNVVDADENGLIEDKDVFILSDLSDQIYNDKIVPYMVKAGIGSRAELMSPSGGANLKFRAKLTVLEYERFTRNMEEWNRVFGDMYETMKAITIAATKRQKLPSMSCRVEGCADWGGIGLSNGVFIKYAGIKIPVGATDNKYSRFVALFSSKLISRRIIRYELTGNKVGNVSEAYVYLNDLFINEELVRRGYALAIRDVSDLSDRLIKLEVRAKERGVGLWAFYPEYDPWAEPLY